MNDSTGPAAGWVPGGNTWGRSDTSAGLASKVTRANAFPPYTGRVTTSSPSTTSRPVASEASGTSRSAATLGARSAPSALAGKSTAWYPPPATMSATMRA